MAVGSFSAGLSGLNANAQALSVIGNNLANINTLGFKASQVAFKDLVSQNIGGGSANPSQVGLGVGLGSISPIFSQGAIESSRVATHVAIQGNGFFMVEGPDGQSYTRAGNFSFDSEGTLVTPDGEFVLGYTQVDPTTNIVSTTGQPTRMVVPPGVLSAPLASTRFQAVSNLDASAPVGSTFTAAIQLYDSLGSTHVATMTYAKTGPNAWTYDLTVEGAEVAGGTPGTPFQLATGTLGFDGSGVLTTIDGAAPADVALTTPAWTNGALANTMDWSVFDAQGDPVLTQFATTSATSSISQNGTPAGMLNIISVDADGRIVATFGSGQSRAVGQLSMATFNNPQGLTKLGANRYAQTESAGLPSVGVAGAGGRGTLIGSALEQSNVDIALEFTQMILAQRGYQANSKTITVSDQILLETINLKQ